MKSLHLRRLESLKSRTRDRMLAYAQREGLTVAELADTRLPWYEIRNQAGDDSEPATVLVYDEIGGSMGVGAEDFARDLEEITADVIHLRINSPGGAVFDALAIYNSLHHHKARVITYVDGLAASAASVVAMAGDEIVMMPGSQMMIHDASATHNGDPATMADMAVWLGRQSDNIADLYRRRAGGDAAQWRELMTAETWMFADEAVEFGLANRVHEIERADPDPDDPMRRGHDLSRFRYAGREAAPAPSRRRAAAGEKHRAGPATTSPRASSDADRRRAAELRRGAVGGTPSARAVARRAAPTGMSTARMAAFRTELRAEPVEREGQRRYRVEGHASIVDVPYEMWDEFGPYFEVIDRSAFTATLAADPDVAFLVNHRGVTMARTTNDSLRLRMDDVGLLVEAWLNARRQDVIDLVAAIEDRDVTEMSFAFLLDSGEWTPDFTQFRITDLDLNRGDVSAVNYGANPYTDVAARSGELLRDLDRLPAGAARAAITRLQERTDLSATTVAQAQRALDALPEPVPAGRGRSIAHIEALLET